ncbi:hypothetical protein D2B06_24940 [Salmonella enterica]|nr:hypothetical protein [Salmonella enterica]EBI7047235.1 hypothetical protein [Salmonella enterica]EBN5763483.1 hypothetical protein [Salmonella enterica]ECV0013908.1 hypothetical protein [Salmonella enterica]MHJ01895.1 hypothetical protein [Salmonella enterica]
MQKNVTPGRRKGCPNYPPEFKQQLVASEPLSISSEVTFRHGTLRLNGTVSEKLLTLLIQELKR